MNLAPITTMDRIERDLANLPPVEFPLEHFFTSGLYTRMIHMPANSLVVSRTHKMAHPFFIIKGKVAVLREKGDGTLEQEGLFGGGHMGITKPGTKRFLFNVEDTTWVTVHPNPNNIQDPDEIVEMISDGTDNPLIDKENPRFNTWKTGISPSIIHREFELTA